MNISIPSILLGLGGKCLLNWTLVFLQRNHICRSFVGVFSVSLALVDTMMALILTTLYIHADGCSLLGSRLTRYHVCLLVQILGQLYSLLQWPVVVVASLDHFCTVAQTLQPGSTLARWIIHSFETVLLWFWGLFYVFQLSDFTPVLKDEPFNQIHHCWAFHTCQILQIVTVLFFLTLSGAALHARHLYFPVKNQTPDQRNAQPRSDIVHQSLSIFLDTWTPLLAFLAVLLLLPVGIPAYLGLNVVWLCFLNSFLIGLAFCAVCPASQLAQGLAAVPSDSFCEWKFKFG